MTRRARIRREYFIMIKLIFKQSAVLLCSCVDAAMRGKGCAILLAAPEISARIRLFAWNQVFAMLSDDLRTLYDGH
jgi:hypothetical protein